MAELPAAVTRGGEAARETEGAVNARRAGIVAGVVTAIYVLVWSAGQVVPGGVIALLGGPRGIARFGGLHLVWRPPAGYDTSKLAVRFAHRAMPAVVHAEGDAVAVDLPGVAADDADAVARIVGVDGGLEFRELIAGDDLRALDGLAPEVHAETDAWRMPDGTRHTTTYVAAPTREAITAALHKARAWSWHPPAGAELRYQRVDRSPDRPETWRADLVGPVLLDGNAIADARFGRDPDSGAATVHVTFTEEGARRFGALSARLVGYKLAMVIGDETLSAPILESAIRGGHIMVTVGHWGARDPSRADREARALVAALRCGALPRGGTVVSHAFVPPADVANLEALARGLFALLAGLLAGALVWLGVRRLRPVWRPWPAAEGRGRPLRVLVTLIPVALLAASGLFLVPGVNRVELTHMLDMAGASSSALAQFSVLALGVMPVMSAFALVELVALAVPRWRWLRHAGPDGRRKLGRAVAVLAIAMALVQGYFVGVYLESLSRGGVAILSSSGLAARLEIAASLAAGTAVLVVLADVIGRRGLGNGYGALLAAGWLLGAGRWLLDHRVSRADHVLGVVAVAAIALATCALLRWRVDRFRLPSCAVAPLCDAFGIAQVIGTLAALGLVGAAAAFGDTLGWIHGHAELMVVALLAFAALWSHVFARPSLVAGVAARAGVAAPDRRSWWRATAASAAGVLAIGAIGVATVHARGATAPVVDVILVMITVAVVLDACEDWRARSRDLVAVWPLHQVQHAELVGDALRAAGIEAHLHASHLRALFAFFGPFAPIVVYVPPADVAAAEARVRAIVLGEPAGS